MKIKNNKDGIFTNIFKKLYEDVDEITIGELDHSFNWDGYPNELVDFLNKFNGKANNNYLYTNMYDINKNINLISKNNKVMVGFSGGKDSLAVVLKLIEMGYIPVLYHLKKINRNYYGEVESVVNIANKLNLEVIIDDMAISGKTAHLENPTKNLFILSRMIDEGIKMNINKFTLGESKDVDLKGSTFSTNWSDCFEIISEYNKFISKIFPNYKFMYLLNEGKDSYNIILNQNKKDMILDVQSCMLPDRYRKNVRIANEKKYNIHQIGRRCGSCYKCALDYLYMAHYKYYIFENKDFYKHLLNILVQKSEMVWNVKLTKKDSIKKIKLIWGISELNIDYLLED